MRIPLIKENNNTLIPSLYKKYLPHNQTTSQSLHFTNYLELKEKHNWLFELFGPIFLRAETEDETPILWNASTLATWCEEPTHLKRPWCWERLKEGGEGDDRGWDAWMAPLPQWTWVWVNSGSWWWTGRPGVLQSMGLQRVGQEWATELIFLIFLIKTFPSCYTGPFKVLSNALASLVS